MGQPYYNQQSFRWRDDDGSETGATWLAVANAAIPSPATDTTYRLRILVQNTGDKAGTPTLNLYYSYNSGTYAQVTAATSYVRMTASGTVSDTTATTQQLGSGSWVAGEFDSNGSVSSTSLTNGYETEMEFCFQFRSADLSGGDTVELRVYDGTAALDNYNVTPIFTTPTPPAIDQDSFRWRNDDGSETTATWIKAANTNLDAFPTKDTPTRIRFLLQCSGANKTDGYRLAYNLDGGTWTAVTTSSSYVRSVASANTSWTLTDGDSTTQQLGSGTHDEGYWDNTGTVSSYTITVGQESELEFCIEFRSADITTEQIGIRVEFDDGTVLDTYTNTTTVSFAAYTFPQVEGETTSYEASATTSHTVSLPTSIAVGELLLIIIALDAGTGGQFGFPAGYTEIKDAANTTNDTTVGVAWRIATGSEGSSITVTSSSSAASAHATYRISDHDSSNAPEISTGASGDGQSADPDSLSPSGGSKKYLWFAIVGADGSGTTGPWDVTAAPTNYTNLVSRTSTGATNGTTIGVARRENEAASEDPSSFTVGDVGGKEWFALTLAVYPAATSAEVTFTVAGNAVSSTATVDLNVTRAVTVTGAATSATDDVDLNVTREVTIQGAAASSITDIDLALIKFFTILASAVSSTTDVDLAVTRTFTATGAAASNVTDVELAVTRLFTLTGAAASNITDIDLLVVKLFTILANAVSSITDVDLDITRAFTVTGNATSDISAVDLDVTRAFTILANAVSSIPDIDLNVVKLFTVLANAVSSITNVDLDVTREFTVQGDAVSSISDIILSVTGIIEFIVSANATSSLTDVDLDVTRLFTVQGDASSSISDIILSVAGIVEFIVQGSATSSLTDLDLDVTRLFQVAGNAASSTADIELAVTRLFTIVGAAASSITDLDLALIKEFILSAGATSSIPDATLAVTRAFEVSGATESQIADAVLAVERAFTIAAGAESNISDIILGDLAAAIVGLMIIALSGSAPRTGMSGSKPDTTMTGSAPDITLTGRA